MISRFIFLLLFLNSRYKVEFINLDIKNYFNSEIENDNNDILSLIICYQFERLSNTWKEIIKRRNKNVKKKKEEI